MALHGILFAVSHKIIPFITAIIGFSAVIAIHEFGHFLFCKLFGIHTPTFSIGFGPELFRRQFGSTNFRLALIPLGGYVEIAGLVEVGQGEQEYAHETGTGSFDSKPYWQKFLVLMGGIIFNLLSAYVIFTGLFVFGTADKQAVMVAAVVKDSAAAHAGLTPGDAVTQINDIVLADQGTLIENAEGRFLEVIRSNPNGQITLQLRRNNEDLALPITLGSRINNGIEIGVLGAELRTPLPQLPFFQALVAGFSYTCKNVLLIVDSLKKFFSQRTLEGAGGPVMILSMSFSSAQHGIIPLLFFLALMSINLALINLLPIGALDGGQLFFATFEAIIRRRLPQVFKNGINIASWLFFIGLALLLTYRDIMHLFGSSIMALGHKLIALWPF